MNPSIVSAGIPTRAMFLALGLIITTTMLSLRPSSTFVSAQSYVNYMGTYASILSGTLTSCATPTNPAATDCLGGLASADAYIRNYTAFTGEPITFAYSIDRNSAFVQMHPLDWGVNRYALRTIFNYSVIRSVHSTLTTERNMTYLQNKDLPLILSNALVPPSSTWVNFLETIHFDPATKIAVICIQSGSEPNSYNSYQSVAAALDVTSRTNGGPWYPVVVFDDTTITASSFLAFVTDLSNVKMRPAAVLVSDQPTIVTTQVNGTWMASYDPNANFMTHFRFQLSATVASQFASLQYTAFDLTKLPLAAKDSYYISKQVWLKNESNKASSNNPVVGQSAFMPLTRTGTTRMCMAGECPLGDLWTDAMRWKGDADIAFESGGGVRGPGWPAGPVKISDLWTALPFVNQLCTGTISGINLYKALNHSVALATFTSTLTNTGDRLLQCSGCRITYNTLLDPANRLVSVEVRNRATGQFEPLQRLKLYKFATNSFICRDFLPFPTFFTSADIQGEVAGKITDDIIQSVIAAYLGSLSFPYDTAPSGRMINDTSAVAMKSFVQTLATCPINTYWRPTVQTCQPCAVGFVNSNPQDGTECLAIPQKTDIVPIAVGIAVPVAVLMLAGLFYYFYRKDKMMRENIRDTENAPKVTGKPLAIIFTDIQASTNLWSVAPLSMSYALEKHNQIINEVIALNKGFFVKAAGDSYMIAVDCTRPDGAQTAAKIVVDIQREMMKASFPCAINQIYNAKTDDDFLDIDDDPNELEEPQPGMIFNGLRVRIGLGIGTCEVKFDALAKTYDYYGPLVNFCARTESSAHGGQILITPDTLPLIRHQDLDCILTSCGKFDLKGIPEPMELHSLLPIELTGRKKFFAVATRRDGPDKNVDNDDVQSEAASSIGEESHNSVLFAEDVLFMNALLRAVKPKEKDQILRILENSWRVRRHKTTEDTLAAITRKVSRVKIMMAEQEERKATRDGRSNAASGGIPASVNINSRLRSHQVGGSTQGSQLNIHRSNSQEIEFPTSPMQGNHQRPQQIFVSSAPNRDSGNFSGNTHGSSNGLMTNSSGNNNNITEQKYHTSVEMQKQESQ